MTPLGVRARRTGAGATSTRATGQKFDTAPLEFVFILPVSFFIGPVVGGQAADDKHRVALTEFGAGFGEFAPDVDLDKMNTLLVLPVAVAVLFVDR